MNTKKIIALILAVVLAVSSLGIPAAATDEGGGGDQPPVQHTVTFAGEGVQSAEGEAMRRN